MWTWTCIFPNKSQSLKVNVQGSVRVQVSEELWHSLDFNEAIVVDVEMIEDILNCSVFRVDVIAHFTTVGMFDFGAEGLGILKVAK